MSTIKVDTIKDETGSNTLVTQSGSNYAWGTGVPKGSVIEQFCSPSDGSSITVQSGTYTVQNVTTAQALTTTFVDFSGSVITYTPPTGTQTVIYTFDYHWMWEDADVMWMHRLKIGGNEVTKARTMHTAQGGTYQESMAHFRWAFHIGGSADTTTGRQATWTSGKEIKLETREHTASQESKVHAAYHWEGAASYQNPILPVIGITALA